YFNTVPAAGSYLATRWNTANSQYVEAGSSHWVLSDGGRDRWHDWRITMTPLTTVAWADFNADGRDDAFRSLGGRSQGSLSGRDEWRTIAYRSDPLSSLLFGDFNGDRTADVVRAVSGSGIWQLSSGGTGTWVTINHQPESAFSLRVGDFDGNGVDDLLKASG